MHPYSALKKKKTDFRIEFLHMLGFMRGNKTDLQVVEVAHGADPVHQQSDLDARVFIRPPDLCRTGRNTTICLQRGQPPFGLQESLQEEDLLSELILIQNHFHLHNR